MTVLRWIGVPFSLVLAFVLALLFGFFIAYTIDFSLHQIGAGLPTDWRDQVGAIVGYGAAAWLVLLVPAAVAPAHQKVVAVVCSSLYWIVQLVGFIAVIAGVAAGFGLAGNILRAGAALVGTIVGFSQVLEDIDYDW